MSTIDHAYRAEITTGNVTWRVEVSRDDTDRWSYRTTDGNAVFLGSFTITNPYYALTSGLQIVLDILKDHAASLPMGTLGWEVARTNHE